MTDLTINGDTFRVEIDGEESNPALLLSNSLGTDLSLWDGQVSALAEHFRVIRYDPRGHGASVAEAGPYSIEHLGRDALAILDALEIKIAHVIGISMGGAVAQWLMINAPERVSRAVLASTTARFMTANVWNGRIATVLRDGMEAVAAATMERWFSEGFREQAPERVAAIEAAVRSTPAQGYVGCSAALRDMDLREAIRAVEHPVLVLTGADDPAISAEDTAHLLEAIAGSRHVELPTRHIANVEAEAAFTQAALDFLLSELPARRAARGARPAAPRSTKTQDRRQARRSIAARAPLPARTTAEPGRAPRGRTSDAATRPKQAEPAAAKPATKSPAKASIKAKVPSKAEVPSKTTAGIKLTAPTKTTAPTKSKPPAKQAAAKPAVRSAGAKGLAWQPRPAKSTTRTDKARTTRATSAAAAAAGGRSIRGKSTDGKSTVGKSTDGKSTDGKSAGATSAAIRSAAAKSATKASPPASTRRGAAPAAVSASTARKATKAAARPARSAAAAGKITAQAAKPAAPRRTAASLAAKAMRPGKGTKQQKSTAAAVPPAKTGRAKTKAVAPGAPKSASTKAQASKTSGPRKPGRPPTGRGAR